MGRGIAHAAALGGYRTILEDILPGALRKAESEIRANLDKAVEIGKVAAGDANAAFARIQYAGSVEEAARQADLVIEAVPEEMESKIEIFTLLDKVCRPFVPVRELVAGTQLVKQHEIVEPGLILAAKLLKPITGMTRGCPEKIAGGLREQRHFPVKNRIVIDRTRVIGAVRDPGSIGPSMIGQSFQADQQRISGEGRSG